MLGKSMPIIPCNEHAPVVLQTQTGCNSGAKTVLSYSLKHVTLADLSELYHFALQMFKRGGIEEVCGLLIQVGNEPAGIVSSPSAKSQSQASADDLHGPCPAPEAGQDGAVQGSDPTADSAEQQSGQCLFHYPISTSVDLKTATLFVCPGLLLA